MFQVTIPEREFFNETTEEFVTIKKETFQIEHSLVSLSKWESKWKIPFMAKNEKTTEQVLDYIQCMTITQNINPDIYKNIPMAILAEISDYISESMTATWFAENPNAKESKEVITAEVIYYWMITHNIPMECQKWHINRLLTLIRVCNVKNAPPKKTNKGLALSERARLNAERLSGGQQ